MGYSTFLFDHHPLLSTLICHNTL